MRRTIPIFVGLALAACAVSSDPVDENVGSSDEGLKQCSTSFKTQYTEPCGTENCGLGAAAMMRYALTCGSENHTAGTMRTYMQGLGIQSGCGGTTAAEQTELMDNVHKKDGGKAFNAINKCTSTAHYTIDDLADDLSNGYVAIVQGSSANGVKAPCGFAGGHAMYAAGYNTSTKTFSIYDPEGHTANGDYRCENEGDATVQWSKTKLHAWSSGFSSAASGYVCAIISKGEGVCDPGSTTTSGCGADLVKTCGSDHTWGACQCVPNTTRVCASPDCCGTCGHATQTCSASHTWVTGVCSNGC